MLALPDFSQQEHWKAIKIIIILISSYCSEKKSITSCCYTAHTVMNGCYVGKKCVAIRKLQCSKQWFPFASERYLLSDIRMQCYDFSLRNGSCFWMSQSQSCAIQGRPDNQRLDPFWCFSHNLSKTRKKQLRILLKALYLWTVSTHQCLRYKRHGKISSLHILSMLYRP